MVSKAGSTQHSLWTQQFEMLCKMLPPKSDRSKRGLFNFVGKLSSSLFGTATQEEVDEIREVSSALQNRQEVIVKKQNIIIGVVNHLSQQQQLTQQKLSEVVNTTNAIEHVIRQTQWAMNSVAHNVEHQ